MQAAPGSLGPAAATVSHQSSLCGVLLQQGDYSDICIKPGESSDISPGSNADASIYAAAAAGYCMGPKAAPSNVIVLESIQ
jgi:hypothetical protein